VHSVDRQVSRTDIRLVIDWLLSNHYRLATRWMIIVFAVLLLGIANLPPTPLDSILAIIGLFCIGVLMLLWLAIILITLIRPRTFAELRNRRIASAKRQDRRPSR